MGNGGDEGGSQARDFKEWVRIYESKKLEAKYRTLKTKNKFGKGHSDGTINIKKIPTTKEGAYVPYSEILIDYQDAAEKAMSEQMIPAEYKKNIKKYFEDLK